MTADVRPDHMIALVRDIPRGRVVSYGDLSRVLGVVALQVGRWMANVPPDVPWHRVVGADGTLRIARRSPDHGRLQRRLLENEGVRFDLHGRVLPEYFDETIPTRLLHA